ncbi:alpha/beta hydrolase [Xylanibacter rodentium]|uniref:Alpha/beta hydrolase n=1 Tax=Xylanibacter rodentium TaxID=2736289 RepID=A0ABX2AUV0_9BACT|nr:alpha/beta hydrolase [Xylanibacter rodentium]NPE12216.1 alpha/beta hydrolase [Prevotella sp. PJ1A]NPE14504.1 alpha/beta hydrolase [Xylanibacter rodentium]NPE39652.1 alpha/beta hydrolase [Prevotella sp. PCJ2]
MKKKRIIYSVLAVVIVLVTAITWSGLYMLSYSLTPDPNRHDMDSAYATLYSNYPYMQEWTDSMRRCGALRDTFVTMPSGERHHALYARNDSAHGRTAVVVHGYKDCAVKFLFLGHMYHHCLGYNVLIPDLHAHGLSDGKEIQMGWKDRKDVIKWTEVAEQTFRDSTRESQIVVHGVSMGAATTMCVSGEELPRYVTCFVEDCGYTSVWDEFSVQLKEQFGLPSFPLLPVTSMLCRLKYGWSFGQASPLKQVAKCRRPMLFIHGETDTFVPSWMVFPLYTAKHGYKEMWITRGTEHASSFYDYPDEYRDRIMTFLR